MPNSEIFKKIEGSAAEMFIQWKGTTVCMDFHCPCGHQDHICNEAFVYFIHCGKCGSDYQLGTQVKIFKVPEIDKVSSGGVYTMEFDKDMDDLLNA